jgi:predicted nucleotidyltransferase
MNEGGPSSQRIEAPLAEEHEVRPVFERQRVPEAVFLEVLDEVTRALEDGGVSYVFIGGVASAVLGRPRWSDDIDIFIEAQDARRCLDVLEEAGFETQETYPDWLYKAIRRGVLVDVIFKSSGDIYLDEEMLARAQTGDFRGRSVRIAPPEDLVVMKAIAHSEPTPRYWHDGLSILAHSTLDWEYLLRRARHGPRRILSLLIYAQSNDLIVPASVIGRLYDSIFDNDPSEGARHEHR